MDFYTPEDISVAKVRLLDDIRNLNSTIKLPHVPQRRDGDQRLVREVDDIMLLLSRLDEHKLLDALPRYVNSSPDNMPSVRLYEGEFNGLMTILKRMDKLHVVPDWAKLTSTPTPCSTTNRYSVVFYTTVYFGS